MDTTPNITGTVFDRMNLSDDACFLCGTSILGDKTREHVFPRWLQNRHGLWDQEITLLNGTSIRYAQLTIPCCASCNNVHLSVMENRVRTAVEGGYVNAASLSPLTMYQWMAKIFYGILRKELTLSLDRRDADAGTIVPEELLQNFSTLHLFLQSIRQPFLFPDGQPFSVLTVNLHYFDGQDDFHFGDNLNLMTAALRTKDVGFIVAFQDAGILDQSYGRYVRDLAGRKVTPIQFAELFAKSVYQVSLFTRTPKFVTATDDNPSVPTKVYMLPIGGLSSKPVVERWVQSDYFEVLSAIMRRTDPTLDQAGWFSPPNHVITWMTDESGTLKLWECTHCCG